MVDDSGARSAAARAQGILRSINPELMIDGRWGEYTNSTYTNAPEETKVAVDAMLSGHGFTAAQLYASHLQAKQAGTSAYASEKAAARDLRAGEVATKLEAGGSVDANRPAVGASKSVVADAIRKASMETGVSEALLTKFVNIESRGNSRAANGRSRGLTQFQPAAWQHASTRRDLGPYATAVWDPYANAMAGAIYSQINEESLRRKGFTDPFTVGVLYLAHQQGADGFLELWKHSKGLPYRTKYVTEEKMRRNPPQDGKGVTLDKGEFARRWLAYAKL